MASINDPYDDFTEFEIDSLEWEDDATRTPSNIVVAYSQPSVSVDTAGRFVTHEIIGGSTVRQKIGEEPLQISVSGVCKERTARDLDSLRDAKYGDIKTDRLNGASITVHFASTSTSPLDDGGAVGTIEKELLYTYDLECVEVTV